MTTTQTPLTLSSLQASLHETPLFDQKTWRLSGQAWPLPAEQIKELEVIGQACHEFYQAVELLYRKSYQNKKILRNNDLYVPWVAEYFDRGKPARLVEHARSKPLQNELPIVMRPDLLWTDDGYVMSELDSVPGGIGLTAFLSELYHTAGQSCIGANEQMLECFYKSLLSKCPHERNPFIAILVSEEASTYRPEMEWLASYHQRKGRKVFVYSPEEVFPLGDALHVDFDGDPHQIDLIYRFFELFDLDNLSTGHLILEAAEKSQVVVTPPMKPFHEEKLSLALFHHPVLRPYWKETLSKAAYRTLAKTIPMSWIVDHDKLPPHAFLHGPSINQTPIQKWEELAEGSRKERELVLKKSGFHEEAWGARSVVLGHDSSKEEFAKALRQASEEASESLSVLQQFHKPRRTTHPIFKEDGSEGVMTGRLRLCPYYFIKENEVQLTGALATFCPADKKIIHGMKDAAMLPSARVPSDPNSASDQ